jgi:hypothetical protein
MLLVMLYMERMAVRVIEHVQILILYLNVKQLCTFLLFVILKICIINVII